MGVNKTTFILVGMVMFVAAPILASQGTVTISAPWVAEGKVYHTSPETMTFIGNFSGVMYVDHGEGHMNTATITCPAIEKIDKQTLEISVEGDCFVTAYNGDTIFGSVNCSGAGGVCEGLFKLTGGTGVFEGISGESEFISRTVFESIILDLGQGSAINSALGLATWPELRYDIPESTQE